MPFTPANARSDSIEFNAVNIQNTTLGGVLEATDLNLFSINSLNVHNTTVTWDALFRIQNCASADVRNVQVTSSEATKHTLLAALYQVDVTTV